MKKLFILLVLGLFFNSLFLNADTASDYYKSGNVYGKKGDYDSAIADYSQAIKINPNYADAYYNRGLAYDDKGDNVKAEADFEEVLRLNPNDTQARKIIELCRFKRNFKNGWKF